MEPANGDDAPWLLRVAQGSAIIGDRPCARQRTDGETKPARIDYAVIVQSLNVPSETPVTLIVAPLLLVSNGVLIFPDALSVPEFVIEAVAFIVPLLSRVPAWPEELVMEIVEAFQVPSFVNRLPAGLAK